MGHRIKVVADMASVSVRTLHHYDHIGLLRPASVSASGYRLYAEGDLVRLQQILFLRELGFSLEGIREIIDAPGFDRKEALRAHRRLLLEKRKRLDRLIESVDRTIESVEEGIPMKGKKMFEGFDESKIEEYREEVRAKYSKKTVDESFERTSKYTKADWGAIKGEMDEIERGMAAAMGRDPSDAAVQGLIDRHFRLINERFYTCTPEIFRGLGHLYVSDDRFTAHYDEIRPGLAVFMRGAMDVYARHHPLSKEL